MQYLSVSVLQCKHFWFSKHAQLFLPSRRLLGLQVSPTVLLAPLTKLLRGWDHKQTGTGGRLHLILTLTSLPCGEQLSEYSPCCNPKVVPIPRVSREWGSALGQLLQCLQPNRSLPSAPLPCFECSASPVQWLT